MHQLKITLSDSSPLIWRRVLVPSVFTFQDLHKVIQQLFLWEDDHLHEFFEGKSYRSSKIPKRCCLDKYFERPKQKATYLYDFGDSWEHEIVFEKLADSKDEHPTCTEGENFGPPEDSGGWWCYYDMLKAVKNPKHPEYEHFLEWLGKDFDPTHFDIEAVNKKLMRIKKTKSKLAA